MDNPVSSNRPVHLVFWGFRRHRIGRLSPLGFDRSIRRGWRVGPSERFGRLGRKKTRYSEMGVRCCRSIDHGIREWQRLSRTSGDLMALSIVSVPCC